MYEYLLLTTFTITLMIDLRKFNNIEYLVIIR